MPEKRRTVAFYARVSTEHKEQISAFENQLKWCDELLKQHPEWTKYKIYSDLGITGTSTKKRPGFMDMIRDAYELNCFDLIVTKLRSCPNLVCCSIIPSIRSISFCFLS